MQRHAILLPDHDVVQQGQMVPVVFKMNKTTYKCQYLLNKMRTKEYLNTLAKQVKLVNVDPKAPVSWYNNNAEQVLQNYLHMILEEMDKPKMRTLYSSFNK